MTFPIPTPFYVPTPVFNALRDSVDQDLTNMRFLKAAANSLRQTRTQLADFVATTQDALRSVADGWQSDGGRAFAVQVRTDLAPVSSLLGLLDNEDGIQAGNVADLLDDLATAIQQAWTRINRTGLLAALGVFSDADLLARVRPTLENLALAYQQAFDALRAIESAVRPFA